MEKEPFNINSYLKESDVSIDELREVILGNLDDILNSLPEIDTTSNFGKLDSIKDGLYRCNLPPDIEFLKNKNNFIDNFEIGVYKLKDKWFLNISHSLNVTLPAYLQSIGSEHLFDLDIHSHPHEAPENNSEDHIVAETVGHGDYLSLENTIDGYCYIISTEGVKSFHLPQSLPGGFTSVHDTDKAWEYWTTNELKMSRKEILERGYWKLQKEFYEKFFGLTNIPWDKKEEIEKILQK